MIGDKLLEMCNATSVAAAAGTALVGSQIDLLASDLDIGNGQPLYLVITVDTSIITGGVAGTVIFALASDASAAVATDGTATIHWQSHDYVTDDDALNALDAGDRIVVPLPAGEPAYERFLGLLVITGTTTTTAGAVSAWLTLDPYGQTHRADATN